MLAASGFVDHELAGTQCVERFAALVSGLLETAADDESTAALRAARHEGCFDRVALASDGRALGGAGLGGSPRRGTERQQRRRHGSAPASSRQRSRVVHVSEVSTVRRDSARNSAERISRNRETVRGNSCTSGPSV